jgi:hypothetical protein
MITIEIDGIDRTDIIQFGSVNKKDNINQQTDTLDFSIMFHPGQGFRPSANSDVVMYDGAEKVFGGKVISVNGTIEGPDTVTYDISCKDYSYDLERLLVTEYYEEVTVGDIIEALVEDWTVGGFTTDNVDCDLVVSKMYFNRITVVEAIQRLADMSGFSWYVDYDKDIHFFSRNTETAPFPVADGNGSYIFDTLKVSDDFSQIRNRVFITGGEVEGEIRTETFNGDATKKQFKLSNKFARVPALTIGGVVKTIGVDYIDEETAFDCFWDYNQQYIRFKDTTIPGAGTNNIAVSGIPLYNLVVQVEEPTSIDAYGIFEYAKTDKNIKSRDEAVSYAKTEIKAYKDGVAEASFSSYTPGLRSGQVISIDSNLFDIHEDYLIQSVQFRMVTEDMGSWDVTLATLRTVGIIDFLLSLLRQPGRSIEDTGDVVLEKTVFPMESIGISESIDINTNDYVAPENAGAHDEVYPQALNFPVVFVAGPYVQDPTNPTDYKRAFITDGSLLG